MTRDAHRSAVYAAEDQLGHLLARGGTIDFFGSSLALPIERRFADLASVQRYADAVLGLPWVTRAFPRATPLRVRERAGGGRAHYESETGVIAIPLAGPAGTRWAARETVVLHEVAHHLVAMSAAAQPAHGPVFCGTLLYLVGGVIGPEAALVLRASFDGAGVPVTDLPVVAPA